MKAKNVILKLGAVVFTAAYLLSLAGFDIHSCSHSGKTYISFLATSLSCEDIHPSHEEECCCCHCHEQHHSNEEGGCCSDEAHQLLLGSDDNGFDIKHVSAPVSELPVAVVTESFILTANVPQNSFAEVHVPPHVPDILHSFCVLRI